MCRYAQHTWILWQSYLLFCSPPAVRGHIPNCHSTAAVAARSSWSSFRPFHLLILLKAELTPRNSFHKYAGMHSINTDYGRFTVPPNLLSKVHTAPLHSTSALFSWSSLMSRCSFFSHGSVTDYYVIPVLSSYSSYRCWDSTLYCSWPAVNVRLKKKKIVEREQVYWQ